VQGADTPSQTDVNRQRPVVDAFLTALRAGDFTGLMAVLDPEVVVRIDETAARPGAPREIHGAAAWAKGAIAFAQLARSVQPMLVDGTVGLVWAPGGRLSRALKFTIANGKIVEAEIMADPARLSELHLTTLDHKAD
jgi:RNA polymerase sigma-70 factor (ECF subfamily)